MFSSDEFDKCRGLDMGCYVNLPMFYAGHVFSDILLKFVPRSSLT